MYHSPSPHSSHSGSYKDWNLFVSDKIQKWVKEFNWLIDCPDDRDVILIRYEDLKENAASEIGRILDFLSFHLNSTFHQLLINYYVKLFMIRINSPNSSSEAPS